MELPLTLIIVLLCLAFESFFSGSEIGIISCNKIRLRHKADSGHRGAKILESFLGKPERLLGTTLVGTNLSVVIGTVIFTTYMVSRFPQRGEMYSFLIMYPLVLILGEILPKTIYQQHADRISLKVSYLVWVFYHILFPIVSTITRLSELFIKALGGAPVHRSPFVSKEQLEQIIRMETRTTEIDQEEKRMIDRIFNLSNTTVAEAMVPLVDVVALEHSSTLDEVIRRVSERGFSRFPVYKESLHDVAGVVSAFDILTLADGAKTVEEIVRKPYYVPEAKRVDDLLKEMQSGGIPMAIVTDEYGACVGIVTIEDLVEEIVGEIQDEYDIEERTYQVISEDKYLIDARMEVDAINERLGFNLEKGRYETLGGYITTYLERIPRAGENFKASDLLFTIKEADERKIILVEVERKRPEKRKKAHPPAGPDDSGGIPPSR